jgi:hypothetical protein
MLLLAALGCAPRAEQGSSTSSESSGTTTTSSTTSAVTSDTSSSSTTSSSSDTSSSSSSSTTASEESTTGEPLRGTLSLIGHHDLAARGMNAALAIVGDHVYVGSRIDGVPHPDTGIMIVDVADPTTPVLVGQIGPALLGMTTRELRAIPEQNLLLVLSFACSDVLHGCTRDYDQFPATGGAAEPANITIYDVADPSAPIVVGRYDWPYSPVDGPHELYLWRDPNDAARVLLFVSVPYQSGLQVLDVSDPSAITVVTTWDPFVEGGIVDDATMPQDSLVHSVGVSDDGNIAFLSLQGSGLALADTSEIAAGLASPTITLLHAPDARIDYAPPQHPGTHSAVEIPGRQLALVTDEIYPKPYSFGCPWGWARLVDYADASAPAIVGEYQLVENDWAVCEGLDRDNVVITAHNATVTEHLAVVSWYGGGLHVIDTSDPTDPRALAIATPEPLASVLVEDPVLFGSPVLTWSTPIVANGRIHVVDIRNGLYIYEYTGPFDDELSTLAFAEGNSNLD